VSNALARLVRRAVFLRPGEGPALLWSAAYFFLVLAGYFVLRPIREEMGVAGGVRNLPYLYTGTLLGVLVLHPVYAWLVARLPRNRFVPYTYRFFILNLVAFFALLRFADAGQAVWVGRAFFIWTSVFNLFVVTVFWSFMADIYRPGQSKRLFGVIAVGGTLGAILGSGITAGLVEVLGPVNLLLVSALLLELAGQASRVLGRHEARLALAAAAEESPVQRGASSLDHSEEVIGGGVLEGVRHVFRSPYLLGIAVLLTFFAFTSTFLWMHLMAIVERTFGDDPVGRTRLFANMELAVQSCTLLTQVFLTSRLLRWFGVTVVLAFLPVLTFVGFGLLGAAPVLAVVVLFQVGRRIGNFALQRPAREILYTVLPRTDKYKAKHFNDTFVYRAADQVGAWGHMLLGAVGLGLSAIAFAMMPVSALWLAMAVWLGRKHREIAEERIPPVRPGAAVAGVPSA
jgi:ATP:ADP antiporter, AAA family